MGMDNKEAVNALDSTVAAEINIENRKEEASKDAFEDFHKNADEFVEMNHNRELKPEKEPELKKMHLSESLFEDYIDEATAVAEPPVKKRTRGENEKKWIGDYSSEDLWLAVYDELSAEIDNEGKGQQVDKQIKARKGERYEHVYPDANSNDIIVYGTDLDKFEFAKRVADHYGVEYDEPKEDKNSRTNDYYKYSMRIRIPEDGLYDGE